jgi:hypothetical protein
MLKFTNPVIEELAEKVLDNQELMKDLDIVDVILGYFESIKKHKDVRDLVDLGSESVSKVMFKWGGDCKKYLPSIPSDELVIVMRDWLIHATREDYEDLVAFAMDFKDDEKCLKIVLFLCQHAHPQLGRSLIYSNWSNIVLKICDIVKNGDERVTKTAFEVLTYVAKDKVNMDSYFSHLVYPVQKYL